MISALEFYRLQKNKRLPAEKQQLVTSTISMVSDLSKRMLDLENSRNLFSHLQSQTLSLSQKKNKKKMKRLQTSKTNEQKEHFEPHSTAENPLKFKNISSPAPSVCLLGTGTPSSLSSCKQIKINDDTDLIWIARKKRKKCANKSTSFGLKYPHESTEDKKNHLVISDDFKPLADSPPMLIDNILSEDYAEECTDVSNLSRISSEEGNDSDLSAEVPINPIEEGYTLLQSLLQPFSLEEFRSTYFGMKPMHSIGENEHRNFHNWLNLMEVNSWLTDEHIMFGKEVEYIGSEIGINTINNSRAFRAVVWSHINFGGSIRFNAPERFSTLLSNRLHLLQEVIGGPISSSLIFTGSTFSGSLIQKHTDADLYILQLEGVSDISFTDRGMVSNPPIINKTAKIRHMAADKVPETFSLVAGDVAYLPRSFKHSVKVNSGERAVQLCILHHTSAIIESCLANFSKDLIHGCSLPHLSGNLGPAHFDKGHRLHPLSFSAKSVEFAYKLFAANLQLPTLGRENHRKPGSCIDGTVFQTIADKIAVHLLRVTAAPSLLPSELACHISEQGEIWCDSDDEVEQQSSDDLNKICNEEITKKPGFVALGVELEPESSIRLVRRAAIHLVESSNGDHRLYHCLNNGRECLVMNESSYLEIQPKDLKLIRHLLDVYPETVTICDLPGDSLDEKIIFANKLYETGVIITGRELSLCPWNESE